MDVNDWITILFLGLKSRHSSKGHLVFWPNNLTDSPTHQEIPHLLSYRSPIPSLVSSLASFKTQLNVTCSMKHYLILTNFSTFSWQTKLHLHLDIHNTLFIPVTFKIFIIILFELLFSRWHCDFLESSDQKLSLIDSVVFILAKCLSHKRPSVNMYRMSSVPYSKQP